MTSSSSFGISQITLQFDLNRDIDAAAQDVQAAINAVGLDAAANLPYPPVYSKVNPADAPIVTLALTSDTISMRALSDLADTLLAQRLSEIDRRRPRHGAGRHPAGHPHPGGSRAARQLRHRHWRTCATPSSRQRRRRRKARSTARTSPTPSRPTTRSPRRAPIATSSSPIATARRCCCAMSADIIDGLENDQGRRLVPGQAGGRASTSSASPAPTSFETVAAHQARAAAACSARCLPARRSPSSHDAHRRPSAPRCATCSSR